MSDTHFMILAFSIASVVFGVAIAYVALYIALIPERKARRREREERAEYEQLLEAWNWPERPVDEHEEDAAA